MRRHMCNGINVDYYFDSYLCYFSEFCAKSSNSCGNLYWWYSRRDIQTYVGTLTMDVRSTFMAQSYCEYALRTQDRGLKNCAGSICNMFWSFLRKAI